jgi:hypothetical protein
LRHRRTTIQPVFKKSKIENHETKKQHANMDGRRIGHL